MTVRILIVSKTLLASLTLCACLGGKAANLNTKALDEVANLTAEMTLRVAFQNSPTLPVAMVVLSDKGSHRIMQVSTAVQVCIVKLVRNDGPRGSRGSSVGWAPKEHVCWER